MGCPDRRLETISAYLDGELRGAEALEVERHLAECPGCAAYAEQLRADEAVFVGALHRAADAVQASSAPVSPCLARGKTPPAGRAFSLGPARRGLYLAAGLLLGVAIGLSLMWLDLPPRPGEAGTLVAVEGEVYLRSYGGDALPGAAGATLRPGSRLRPASPAEADSGTGEVTTGEASSATIATADGCRIRLAENTHVVFYAERVIHQASGRVDVQFPASGRCADVIVDTDRARVVGHGGRITVLTEADGDWVVAHDGSVGITPSSGLGGPAVPLEGHVGAPAAARVLASGEILPNVTLNGAPDELREP